MIASPGIEWLHNTTNLETVCCEEHIFISRSSSSTILLVSVRLHSLRLCVCLVGCVCVCVVTSLVRNILNLGVCMHAWASFIGRER